MRRWLMEFFYGLAKRCDPDRKGKVQAEAELTRKYAHFDGPREGGDA
jgi:hypothetical protein